MAQPVITVIGNVATQPRLTPTRQGRPATMFRVAQTQRRRNRDTGFWEDGDTSWYRVVVWKEWCRNVAKSMTIGHPVIVVGRLKVRDWTRDGKSGTDAEIDAITIGHDLRRGETAFTKVKLERPDLIDEDDSLVELYRRDDEEFAAALSGEGPATDGRPEADPHAPVTDVPFGEGGGSGGPAAEDQAA
ncbi:MAG TPA: single-stranded DNA-binding protein [Jiangellaceae bacterium]|nr:single-stranded DNA-binding protein [Jiangellaceae bacterium]